MSRDHLTTVLYPRHPARQDALLVYAVQLLELACARSGQIYELQQARDEMSQARALIELGRPNPPMDVYWSVSNREREQRLLAIRIPIDRGLMGWRLPLVRRVDLPRFAGVQRLRDLAAFDAVQMHDWPDTAILRANGLPVQTSTQYESLFVMLSRGRVDYFPRSLLEVASELEFHGEMDLVIEPRLLLYYRAPLYFFVSPSRPRLAADLTQGLEAALADGSVDRLFRRHFAALLDRHRTASRVVMQLHNPDLSAQTPVDRGALWALPAQLGAPAQGR